MKRSNVQGRSSSPLNHALSRLADLKADLHEVHEAAELGEAVASARLTQQLDELDRWLDELTTILADRRERQRST
jgi:hypothetical protein